ncbi:hypothetical protein [Streptomyces sp. CBMA123]|uniref:hypothetical protein n=1 Tax=Streptomyces sp. CBMA123 TaxID=1896313 RepID=UPI001661C53C|nr:hypothetical protein [Streptomyces sp. CBMA123]MBD0695838.1 hypothetical protein [Streptomyces sp. CBMA123]
MTTPVFSPFGVFARLDAEWALLCADQTVRSVVTGWLEADRLAPAAAAAAGAWAADLGPDQVLAALRPAGERGLGDGQSDAMLRALLRRVRC